MVQVEAPLLARLWGTTLEIVRSITRNNLPEQLSGPIVFINPKATRDPQGGMPLLKDPNEQNQVNTISFYYNNHIITLTTLSSITRFIKKKKNRVTP